MRRIGGWLPLAGLLILGLPLVADAQVSLGGLNLEGAIEAGPRIDCAGRHGG